MNITFIIAYTSMRVNHSSFPREREGGQKGEAKWPSFEGNSEIIRIWESLSSGKNRADSP